MKRFFLIFSAFTVLLSVFTVLLSAPVANAASVYDDVIELTPNLLIGNTGCIEEVDLGSNDVNWAAAMTAGSGTFTDDNYTWDWQGSYESQMLDFWDEKTYWGVVLQPSTQICYLFSVFVVCFGLLTTVA